jgi:hypothetical protein
MNKTKPKQQLNPIANELCRLLHKKRIEINKQIKEIKAVSEDSVTDIVIKARYHNALECQKKKILDFEILLDTI